MGIREDYTDHQGPNRPACFSLHYGHMLTIFCLMLFFFGYVVLKTHINKWTVTNSDNKVDFFLNKVEWLKKKQ